jgi:hypothetical protein
MKNLFFIAAFIISANSFAQLFKTANSTAANNLLLYSLCLAQNDTPEPKKQLSYHSGVAVTSSGDTLKGNICLKEQSRISIVTKRNALNIDTLIDVENVILVRLFDADSLLNNQSYTDYIKFEGDNHYLWRQVYKGNFELYDDLYASNESPGKTGDFLMVKENGKSKTVSGFWTTSPKKKMIEYVNTRYSKDFTKKDFASVVDIINWLKLNG